ncbi:MAG: hypothetical protein HC923_06210 [Myxococcales bacterium]|nr:hypothetical protein [Myxococcales bacterium]
MKLSTLLSFLFVCMAAIPAQAQDHELYFARAGAYLAYADAESRITYAALTDKIFDPTVAQQSIDELKRILDSAKRQLDRAAALLPEAKAKNEADILAVREKVVSAERQLDKLNALVAAEVEALQKALSDEEEELEEEEGEEKPETDWAAIRGAAAWFAEDVSAAKTAFAVTSKKLVARPIKPVPKPRGAEKIDQRSGTSLTVRLMAPLGRAGLTSSSHAS